MPAIRKTKTDIKKTVSSVISSKRFITLYHRTLTISKTGSGIEKAVSSAISPQRFVNLYRRTLAIGKTREGMKKDICSAINTRRLIEFYYHGGFRLVEPFCLGEIIPRDRETLLCYQVSGHVEFDVPVGWKLYRFSEMSKLRIVDDHFSGGRPGYDPDNLDMTTIYCCVSLTADEKAEAERITELSTMDRGESLPHEKSESSAVSSPEHYQQMQRFRISHSDSSPGPTDDRDED